MQLAGIGGNSKRPYALASLSIFMVYVAYFCLDLSKTPHYTEVALLVNTV